MQKEKCQKPSMLRNNYIYQNDIDLNVFGMSYIKNKKVLQKGMV